MLPRIALTLGDVAGIGPEVIVRAWSDTELFKKCQPICVGHPAVVERAIALLGDHRKVRTISGPEETSESGPGVIACWNPGRDDAALVPPGANDARAGCAAFDYLIAASRATLAGQFDAIVTAPLSKAALNLAGLNYPGHTEILAEACGVSDYGMMLYLAGLPGVGAGVHDVGVVHTTLHTSVSSVPGLLHRELVLTKIRLIDQFLKRVGCRAPRIAVCALNPHAGEAGLFGSEESTIIAPAVQLAGREGIAVTGPLPADTVFRRAVAGEFDGVVAMYHDQGHIAIKLVGQNRAVNVTLGLPIVRTSPSHGTAFDIAWKGLARAEGMSEAIRLAALLAPRKESV
jgi:4-hydroxythreonine-4-phosphate dehydrogenase